MVRHSGGDVDVRSGTGFSAHEPNEPKPLVRLTVASKGSEATIMLRPREARAIGLDLIGAAHSSIADTLFRTVARREGIDSDGLLGEPREATDAALGPG